ncbi:hypothetical protein TrST_g838 [Triparma strigata]|uniref:Uncharacterized protein n=1 Tax=Triparma strigata TaxID=1606541 RepID=A0A9W7BWS8_9STRA|nr:hypothetical protein TrST_g838 [Triparma strigata]
MPGGRTDPRILDIVNRETPEDNNKRWPTKGNIFSDNQILTIRTALRALHEDQSSIFTDYHISLLKDDNLKELKGWCQRQKPSNKAVKKALADHYNPLAYADLNNQQSRAFINNPQNAAIKDKIQVADRKSKAKAISTAKNIPDITTPLATTLSLPDNIHHLVSLIQQQRNDLIPIITSPLNKLAFTDTGIIPSPDGRVYNIGLLLPLDDRGNFRYYSILVNHDNPTKFFSISSWDHNRQNNPVEYYTEAKGQKAIHTIIGKRCTMEWSDLRTTNTLDYRRILTEGF